MATIEVLKEGDKFIARKGKSILHGVAHTKFFEVAPRHERYGGGYINVQIDGMQYDTFRPNMTLYMRDNWEIEVKAPSNAEIIEKMPVPTLFKLNGVRYIKVGRGAIVVENPFPRPAVAAVRGNTAIYSAEEFDGNGTIHIFK